MGREDRQEKTRQTYIKAASRQQEGWGRRDEETQRQTVGERKKTNVHALLLWQTLPHARPSRMAPPPGSPALLALLTLANLLQPFAHCSVRIFWSPPKETLSLIAFLPLTCKVIMLVCKMNE